MGTSLHRLHRRLLADGARQDDERQIKIAFFENMQRLQPAETGNAIVGDNDIPRMPGKSISHTCFGIYSIKRGVEITTF